MDFQETFEEQATAKDHFFNYYKNETYFENKYNYSIGNYERRKEGGICILERGGKKELSRSIHTDTFNLIKHNYC